MECHLWKAFVAQHNIAYENSHAVQARYLPTHKGEGQI